MSGTNAEGRNVGLSAGLDAELAPCPFCGRTDALAEAWRSVEDGDDWTGEHDDSAYIVCDASNPGGPGGCGASGGHRPTMSEARSAWNTRASND